MTDGSVIHDTFSIGHSYPAAPSRVFAAFASTEAKDAWGGRRLCGPVQVAEPGASARPSQNPASASTRAISRVKATPTAA